MAVLPPGAQRSLTDPYAEKKSPWKFYLLLILILGGIAYLWHSGYIHPGTIDELKQRLVSAPNDVKPDTEKTISTKVQAAKTENSTATVPQPDAAVLEQQPAVNAEEPASESAAKTPATETLSDETPSNAPPSKTAPAPKPSNR